MSTPFNFVINPVEQLQMFRALLLLALFTAAAPSFSNSLYRYVDESGNVVLDRHIPPEAVPKGYDILNERGRVIQTIAPALTDTEIAAIEAEKLRKKEREEQAKVDQALMQRYSHPNDATRMLERRVKEFERLAQIKYLQRKKSENIIIDTERDAADLQRAGRQVKQEMFDTISTNEKQIEAINREIVQLKEELYEVVSEFEKTIERLETLTGKSATDLVAIKERAAQFGQVKASPST